MFTAAPGYPASPAPVPGTPSRQHRGRGPTHVVPDTLRGRLTLTLLGLVVGVLTILGIYLAIASRQLYVDRLANQLAAQARIAAAAAAPALETGEGIAAVDPLVKRLGVQIDTRLTIVAADGTVLGDSRADPRAMDNHGQRPEIVAAHAASFGESTRHSATLDTDFLYVAVPIPGIPGAVARVAYPLEEVDAAVWRIQRDIAAAALIAAGLAAVVGAVVARRITEPLAALRRQAQLAATGQLDATVQPAGDGEIRDLGDAFNAMLADLRQMVAEQERTRSRLTATLANLSEGVIISDDAGVVLQLNDAATDLLGTTRAAAVGRPIVVASRDHDLGSLLRKALSGSEPQARTVEHGPGQRVLEVTARSFTSGDERLGLVVLRDVTELRRLERVRREFVANVSHELRTPLTSIRAVVETLAAGAREDPEVATEFLGHIVGEVDQLAGLVDELLDLARLEAGQTALAPEPASPADILSRAVERLRPQAERAGLSLRVAALGGLPSVRVDRARIEQVLVNLIHNAVKFTPAGGEIVASAQVADGMLRVSVRDTGVGIAAEELPRVFERFYKSDAARRSPGSGLGLAIAKHVVQAHGGTIAAASAPGQGTTISFTVPLAEPPHPV